jgi:hypothetical protein
MRRIRMSQTESSRLWLLVAWLAVLVGIMLLPYLAHDALDDEWRAHTAVTR